MLFRRIFLVFSALAVFSGAMGVAQAAAFETVTLPGSHFTLGEGETRSLSLEGFRYVSKILIRCEGRYRDAQLEVMANGDVKGTIYAPGSDPSYIVTIAESSATIELRSLSGTMNVRGVQAVVARRGVPAGVDVSHSGPVFSQYARNQAMDIASRAISIAQQLEQFVSYKELGMYVLPLKKTAGRVYSVASARGDLSSRVHQSLGVLKNQIAYLRCFLDEAMEREAVYGLAIELMSLEEEIAALLI